MSSVANYLGMGDLIAGARNFKLKINGVEKTGTFQQKAKGKDSVKRGTKMETRDRSENNECCGYPDPKKVSG